MEPYLHNDGAGQLEVKRVEPPDTELVQRARRGQSVAFHALIDRHAPALMGLAVMLTGDHIAAQDVLQETFLGAFKGLATFEERASVKTWLSKILVRQVARHRRNHPRLPALPPDSAAPVTASTDPRTDLRLDLMQTLGTLTEEHRQVIVLRELQGLTYDEMAQLLNVPRGTIESRLSRARAQLRQKLKGYLE